MKLFGIEIGGGKKYEEVISAKETTAPYFDEDRAQIELEAERVEKAKRLLAEAQAKARAEELVRQAAETEAARASAETAALKYKERIKAERALFNASLDAAAREDLNDTIRILSVYLEIENKKLLQAKAEAARIKKEAASIKKQRDQFPWRDKGFK